MQQQLLATEKKIEPIIISEETWDGWMKECEAEGECKLDHGKNNNANHRPL